MSTKAQAIVEQAGWEQIQWLEEYQQYVESQTDETMLKAYDQFRRNEMTKYSDVVKSESKTLSAKDLAKPVRVTIAGWEMTEFDNDGKKVEKVVLHFENAEKGMVLNLTRAEQIAMNLCLDDMEDWSGKQIILEKGRTKFGSEMVDCVAVRDEAPKQKVEEYDDDIPF